MIVVQLGKRRAISPLERAGSNRGVPGPKPISRRAAERARYETRSGRSHRRRGATAAELALLLPLLLFMLLGAIDFCRLFYAYTTITNCARNGALWASDPLANGTVIPSQSPYATVQAAALADANGLNPALTAAEVTSTGGTDGNGNATVTVTVKNYPFKMISSYLGFSSVNISRQVTMRVAPAAPN